MKKILNILLVLSLLATFVFAWKDRSLLQEKILTSYGIGEGKSRNEAVKNAILEALNKIDGLNISKKTHSSFFQIKRFDGSQAKLQYHEAIEELSGGKVDSYKIQSLKKSGILYVAKVKIQKTKKFYNPPELDKKLRGIVVYPVYKNASFDVFSKPNTDLVQKLNQEVLNELTKTKKFAVLDRQSDGVYAAEKFVIQAHGSEDEMLKLGKVLGADYIYVFFIEDFGIKKDIQKDSLTGIISEEIKGWSKIRYRFMIMATRQIKNSGSKSFVFKAQNLEEKKALAKFLQSMAKSLSEDTAKMVYLKDFKIEDEEKIDLSKTSEERAEVSEEEKPSEVKQTKGGGVLLPFD